MTGMLVERDPVVVAPPARPRARRLRNLPAHWPLSFALLGFPLWWAMGLRTIIPMAMTLVMADQLLRKRRLVLPWRVHAVGAVPRVAPARGLRADGGRARRGARGWAVDLSGLRLPGRVVPHCHGRRSSGSPTCASPSCRRRGSTSSSATCSWSPRSVASSACSMPHLEFTSPVEMVLPRGLRSNGLVEAIAHPAVADIQNVLGRPEARPKAPFPFANSWGSNFSMYLPFFLVAWFRYGQAAGSGTPHRWSCSWPPCPSSTRSTAGCGPPWRSASSAWCSCRSARAGRPRSPSPPASWSWSPSRSS